MLNTLRSISLKLVVVRRLDYNERVELSNPGLFIIRQTSVVTWLHRSDGFILLLASQDHYSPAINWDAALADFTGGSGSSGEDVPDT